jgi:hypothetical protein
LAVRELVPFIERDQSLTPHLAALEALVASGAIVQRVEREVGDLLSADAKESS